MYYFSRTPWLRPLRCSILILKHKAYLPIPEITFAQCGSYRKHSNSQFPRKNLFREGKDHVDIRVGPPALPLQAHAWPGGLHCLQGGCLPIITIISIIIIYRRVPALLKRTTSSATAGEQPMRPNVKWQIIVFKRTFSSITCFATTMNR